MIPKNLKVVKDKTLQKLQDHIKALNNPPYDPNTTPSFKPSTFGSECLRKLYYEYFKVEKDVGFDVRTSGIFELGKAIETMVMEWMTAIGEVVPYHNPDGSVPMGKDGKPNTQFPISLEPWRIKRGYIDNIAILDGKLWIYEIKSSASFKYQGLDEPMYAHKVQTACYYLAATIHLAKGDWGHIQALQGVQEVAGVKLLYYNKDTSDMRVFTLLEPEILETMQEIEEKINRIIPYLDNRILPPATEDKCRYCNFAKKCKIGWNMF